MTDEASSNTAGEETWRAIEPYWESVDIYGTPEVFQSGFKRVPEQIGHLLAVWWCNSEVCNGGFHQFFSNPTGILAPEALLGYQAIGLMRCTELVDTAIRMFGKRFPRDRETRLTRLSELKGTGISRKEWDPFYSLDDKYYAAKRQENLFAMTDRYAIDSAR